MPEFTINKHWFGRKPPAGTSVVAAWGCRAILSGRGKDQWVDILHDRQQAWFADEEHPSEAFVEWLKKGLSAWLNQKCGVFTFDDGLCHATASANASYGYFYVGAWMTEPA
jgi:hypothetical protein